VLNLCQVIGPMCCLVVEIFVFINKFFLLCLWSLFVEILVFLNKCAPLCSLRCLVGPLRPPNFILIADVSLADSVPIVIISAQIVLVDYVMMRKLDASAIQEKLESFVIKVCYETVVI